MGDVKFKGLRTLQGVILVNVYEKYVHIIVYR